MAAESEADASVAMPKIRFRIQTADRPNVRKQPTTSARVIGHATSGGEYDVLSLSSGLWFQIRLENGNIGWISSKQGTVTQLLFPFEEDNAESVSEELKTAEPVSEPESEPVSEDENLADG